MASSGNLHDLRTQHYTDVAGGAGAPQPANPGLPNCHQQTPKLSHLQQMQAIRSLRRAVRQLPRIRTTLPPLVEFRNTSHSRCHQVTKLEPLTMASHLFHLCPI
jgi:hypothetical protein